MTLCIYVFIHIYTYTQKLFVYCHFYVQVEEEINEKIRREKKLLQDHQMYSLWQGVSANNRPDTVKEDTSARESVLVKCSISKNRCKDMKLIW